MPSPLALGVVLAVCKSCVQRVINRTQSLGVVSQSSTETPGAPKRVVENYRTYLAWLHMFCTRFYPRIFGYFTGVFQCFSTVSTPLIIRTVWKRNEKLLIGQGG